MLNNFRVILGLLIFQCSNTVNANCCIDQFSSVDSIIVDSPATLQNGKLHYSIGSASIYDKDKNSIANYNRSKNFIVSCQAHKIFYVDAYGNTPFKCAMDATQKIDLSAEGGNAFTLQPTKPIKLNKQQLQNIQYGMDLHIISKKPLKNSTVEFSNLKGKELSYYTKLAQEKTKKIKTPVGYLKTNRLKTNIYRASDSYQMLPKKYRQNGFEFIFIPAYTIEDELSLDLVSAVFIKNKQGRVNYLGEQSGCIVRPAADLNNDGFSELVIAECEPGEGGGTGVETVYPEIQLLASWYSS